MKFRGTGGMKVWRNPRFTIMLGACSICIALAGCSESDSHGRSKDRPAANGRYQLPHDKDAQEFWGSLRAFGEASSAIYPEETFAEFLPNQEFSLNGGTPAPTTDGVVFGEITSVEPGRGYKVVSQEPAGETPDADGGTVVAFDDPDAEWRIADVTVDVLEAFGTEENASTVRFGEIITGPDVESQMEGLAQLGSVVVIIDGTGQYSWDEDLYSVARGGELLGDVDANGHIGFPALGEESGTFVGGVDTLGAVQSEIDVVKGVIDADIVGGILTRILHSP